MKLKAYSLSFLLVLSFFLFSFRSSFDSGVLEVRANSAGTYEIYSIAGDLSLQFVSERLGRFNEDISLSPGQYLILADCSHALVVIHPGKKVKLVVHSIEFIPPIAPQSSDLFTVQCTRYEKSHLRQQITNRFNFFMLAGAKDILVGMVPLKIDLPSANLVEPKTLRYHLAAVRLDVWQGFPTAAKSPYFVSPQDSLLSITQAQDFGLWQFLLPGQYQISINGTKKIVALSEKESLSLKPATLIVKTKTEQMVAQGGNIEANPFYIEINQEHSLSPNTHYPILPGPALVRLSGSNHVHKIELLQDGLNEIKLKSVLVQLGCSPWEWECLGRREVELFSEGEHYPFMTSVTDMPIFYLHENISLGLVGSTGIRYKIPAESQDTLLKAAKVTLEPKPVFKIGQYTDLVRLEGADKNLQGFSTDMPAEGPSTVPLIEGSYLLSRFTSFTSAERDRVDSKKGFSLKAFEEKTIEVPYYVNESRLKKLARDFQHRKEAEERRKLKYERQLKRIVMY